MRKLLNILAVSVLLLIELAVIIPVGIVWDTKPTLAYSLVYGNAGGTITTNGLYTIHTFNNSSDAFVPCASGSILVEVWGAGGGGGTDSSAGGGGGGGGGYSNSTISVILRTPYLTISGTGGILDSAVRAGNSSFTYSNGSAIVFAAGGMGTADNTAGVGGNWTLGIGTNRYSGGNGGAGENTADCGGGGGGAGGPNGNGSNGAAATTTLGGNGGAGNAGYGGAGGLNISGGNGSPGTANALGGGGGAGSDTTFNGGIGGFPGGGAGGGEGGLLGTGANGKVVVTCLTSDFMVAPRTTQYITSTSTWVVPGNVTSIDVLVVGGGGGGSTNTNGGGGGAGGLVTSYNRSVYPGQIFYVVIGSGGAAGTPAATTNGTPTMFGNITALGGGKGGDPGANGGSGGGSGSGGDPGGSGIQTGSGGGTGYGNNGDTGGLSDPSYAAGGGGGALQPGYHHASTSIGGAGGSGLPWTVNNTSIAWFGGGGGGLGTGTTGAAGQGNGAANTGGGGTGTAGYSGVVVINYLTEDCSTPPSAPNNLTLTPQSNSFKLTWNKGSGAYYTRIARKAGSLPANLSDGTLAYLGTGNSFEDGTLTPGVVYYYLAGSESFIGGLPGVGFTQCNSSTTINSSATCLAHPVVTTGAITDITETSAVLHGTITSLEGQTTLTRGFAWDTSPNTSSEYTTESGAWGTGAYTIDFDSLDGVGTPLVPGTTYYIRAYVTCSNGASYGTETSFTTLSPIESSTAVTIRDDCGTSRTHLVAQADINVSSYINAGFLQSSGLDQELYEGSSARFSMLNTSPGWVRTIVPSLVTYGTKDFTWYTGVRPSDTLQDSIIGLGGSVNTAITSDFVPGNSYNISWSGYLNSSAEGPILEKAGSFGIGSFGNGSLWAYVYNGSATNSSQSVGPLVDIVAAGATITKFGSTTYSGAVNESVSPTGNDSDTTFLTQNTSVSAPGNVSVTMNFSGIGFITSINTTTSAKSMLGTAVLPKVRGGIIFGGTTYWGTYQTLTTSYATFNSTVPGLPNSMSRFGNFSNSGITGIFELLCGDSAGRTPRLTQVYWTYYYEPASAVIRAVASGSHTVNLVGNSSYMGLYVDGVETDHLHSPGLPVVAPNSSVSMDTDVAMATRECTIVMDGLEILDWGLTSPLTGTTLPDTSGHSHNGSVVWGSTSGCLEVTYGGTESGEDYSPPADTGGTGGTSPEMIPGLVPTSNDSAWWRGTTDVSDSHFSSLPMYGLFKRAADAGWGSVYVLYMFAMIATSVVLGLITYLATGSYLVASIAVGVTLFGASTTGVISGWIVAIYGMCCAAYITVARSL